MTPRAKRKAFPAASAGFEAQCRNTARLMPARPRAMIADMTGTAKRKKPLRRRGLLLAAIALFVAGLVPLGYMAEFTADGGLVLRICDGRMAPSGQTAPAPHHAGHAMADGDHGAPHEPAGNDRSSACAFAVNGVYASPAPIAQLARVGRFASVPAQAAPKTIRLAELPAAPLPPRGPPA